MALIISVKVVPSSGKYEWVVDKNGALKCYLKSAPEKGAANKELVKNVSKLLKVPQIDIEIIAGLTDRNKTIKIHAALTLQQFLTQVGIYEQQKSIV